MLRLLTAMRAFWLFGASVLLTKGMSLVTIPLVTGRLAPSDYGRLELVTSVVEAFAIVMTLGLADSLFRFAGAGSGRASARGRRRPDRNGADARGGRRRASAGRRLDARAAPRPRLRPDAAGDRPRRGDALRPDRIAARVAAPSRARRRLPRVHGRPDAAPGRRHGGHAERRVRRRRPSGRQRLRSTPSSRRRC